MLLCLYVLFQINFFRTYIFLEKRWKNILKNNLKKIVICFDSIFSKKDGKYIKKQFKENSYMFLKRWNLKKIVPCFDSIFFKKMEWNIYCKKGV